MMPDTTANHIRRKEHLYLISALLISLFLLLSIQLPRIVDPFIIERDYRSLGLFLPEPLSTELRTNTELATPMYTLLMLTAGRFMSPALFAKLLAIPLLLVSVYYIFLLGRQLAGSRTALGLALGFTVFNLAADTEVSVVAGLQRSFTCPLLLALLYYLHHKRWMTAALVVALTGTIYLPILPVAILTYILSLVQRNPDGEWDVAVGRRRLLPLVIVALIILVATAPALLPRLAGATASAMASFQNGVHLLNDPRYQPGGKGALFVIFPIFGRAGFVSSPSTAMQLIILGVLALCITLVRRRRVRSMPPVLKRLFYASLIAFALSWLSILLASSLLLYLPSRHTEFSFFLLLVFYVFLNVEDTLNDLVSGIHRNSRRLVWLALPFLLLALGVILAGPTSTSAPDGQQVMRYLLIFLLMVLVVLLALFTRRRSPPKTPQQKDPRRPPPKRMWVLLGALLLLASPLYIRATGPAFHSPEAEQRALYAFLQTLPPEALIAGSPCALDDVLFYAERRVLYSCWRFREKEALAGLEAYYAERAEDVGQFCANYGVDYLIVDEETLDSDLLASGNYFYEPYVTMLQPQLEKRTDFALDDPPSGTVVYSRGTLSVLACDPAIWNSQLAQ